MIRDSEIRLIGSLVKPHGIKGEIMAEVDEHIDLKQLRCIVVKIDGINVPFFITSVRPKSSSTWLVQIDGIDNEIEAKTMCGKDLYALSSDLSDLIASEEDDDRLYLSDLIGYEIYNQNGNVVGHIDDYDDSTDNTLLIIKNDKGKQIYIPINDELVIDINTEKQTMALEIPEGLIDINN
ncbi:MAG: ribosome maturation factor RimM [Bacteroides sp.]|nr:ribosome maturation factor RimM [Bacteroides sp.]